VGIKLGIKHLYLTEIKMTKFQPAQYLPHAPKTSIELTIAPTQCPTQAYILFNVQCLVEPLANEKLRM
jgi:hypothetical protein